MEPSVSVITHTAEPDVLLYRQVIYPEEDYYNDIE